MADETENKEMTSQAEIDAAFAAAAVPTVDGEAAAPTERILNQDEIDSLLGFDVATDQVQDKSGVRAIINSTLVSYERLPMLEIVFDRLVRLMTTSCAISPRTTSKSAWTTSPPSGSATT
jgi:flagellar motor switch protein FliM